MIDRRFVIAEQQGAALLSALMIMALCATLGVFLLLGQRLFIHQTTLANTSDRLTLALHGVQDWGIAAIESGQDIRKIKAYHVNDSGIKISGMIYALGGRFNMNSLQNSKNISLFASLLKQVCPGQDGKDALMLALQVARWLGMLPETDKYYLSLHPAYRPAGRPLVMLSELRLIKGMTAELYHALVSDVQPYITVLPNSSAQINVNYVSAPVLMSVLNISDAQARSIVACRNHSALFTTVDDFVKQCGENLSLERSNLSVNNPYYQISGTAQQGEQRLLMKSLIKVSEVDGKRVATLVWQEYNGE